MKIVSIIVSLVDMSAFEAYPHAATTTTTTTTTHAASHDATMASGDSTMGAKTMTGKKMEKTTTKTKTKETN